MSKHTPGPWRYDKQNGSPTTGQHMIAGSIPGYLAEVRDCGSGDVQANARLIAAAPDLLAACKQLIAECEAGYTSNRLEANNMVRAAIAKAEGKS